MRGIFITGTDTDVGKTVAAAWAMLHLDGCYWKPVQAGREPETDAEAVQRMTRLPADRVLPEAYVLEAPQSPHEAARREGVAITLDRLTLPRAEWPIVVEGAGGLMVPLNDTELVIDLIAALGLPVILVARSTLGTINHTLLSLQALRRRELAVAGVILNGPRTPHNRAAIERYGAMRVIAEILPLDPVTRDALLAIEPEIDLARCMAASA